MPWVTTPSRESSFRLDPIGRGQSQTVFARPIASPQKSLLSGIVRLRSVPQFYMGIDVIELNLNIISSARDEIIPHVGGTAHPYGLKNRLRSRLL